MRRRRVPTGFVSERHARAMPLSEFPAGKQEEIAGAVAQDRPPARWLSFGPPGSPSPLCQIQSRAWWEWHWQRGRDPEKERRGLPKWLRARVIERDGLTCGICEMPVEPGDVHIDHIHPVAQGGTDDLGNLRVTHSLCNIKKGARI